MGLLLSALLLAGCRPDAVTPPGAASESLQEVDLQLNWFPEAEHGGYYAALAHGYFEDEGLRVRIRPGGPSVPVIQNVATKRAAFGIANADNVLLGRAQEADVVAVMAPLQDSPRCILVHEESGIRRLEDLKNITLAMGSGSAFSHFLRKKLPLDGVQIVPYSGNVAQFLLSSDYAQQAYSFSEPFVAEQQGAKPVTLMVSELGFNPYTSLLCTHGDLVREQPELVRKMVRASVRGWKKYLDTPETANQLIHAQNPEMNADILAFGAEAIRPLSLPGDMPAETLGGMTAERWRTLADQLVEIELLEPSRVEPSAAFTTRFLEDPANAE